MNKIILFAALFIVVCSCTQTEVLTTTKEILNAANGGSALTNDEVIRGLKEALTVATKNSTASASKLDGFYKNPQLFIPWPAEAQAMREKLIQFGFENQIIQFEASLNHAAEEAAKNAAPVFIDAVKGMSISDGFAILNGNDTSATHYLREKTFSTLKVKFFPVVKNAIDQVNVTAYWSPLVTTYNKIPGVVPQNPDLTDYVTNRAINGLMVLIGKEETNIRRNAGARVTELLKKVFGRKK